MDFTYKKRSRVPGFLKILFIIIAIIALILFAGRLFFRIPVKSYYTSSRKAFEIPEISDGYIPQGISYDDESDMFFLTGYMNDESASPIYLVNRSDGEYKKSVFMKDGNGPMILHAGGLAVHGEYVYVAGGDEHCLFVFDKNEILNAENGAEVTCLGRYMLENAMSDYINVSFLTSSDGKLYIGEFYREENYPTLPTHKVTTPAGDDNTAVVIAIPYSTEDEALFGLSDSPSEAYSIPGLVQGMCFNNNKVYLSTSYGAAFSHISVYEDKVDSGRTIKLLGADLPLYVLDSDSLKDSYKIPPMAEEIEFVNDEMFTLCESASKKYKFGKLTGAKWCYATKFPEEETVVK